MPVTHDYQATTRAEYVERLKALDPELVVPKGWDKQRVYHELMDRLRTAVAEITPESGMTFVAEDEDYDEDESPEVLPGLRDAIARADAPGALLAVVPADPVDDAMRAWRDPESVIEPASTLPEMSRWAQMEIMAKVLCRSALMPKHFRTSHDKEADCMVILLTAHDLGLTTTLALRKVHVIDGSPTLGADLMRLLMQRDGHDIKINVTKDADGKAVEAEVLINRKEWAKDDWRGDTYSMEDARTAGLLSKTNWKQHPKAMLIARATSAAARAYCSDSLGGISYTPEELGAIDVEEAHGPAQPAAPPSPLLTDVERQAFRDRIGTLNDEQRAWASEAWKRRGIPPLTETPTRLTEQHRNLIAAVLDEAEELPSDAEVVDETVTVADVTLLPCEDDAELVEPEVSAKPDPVDGVPDRGGPTSVSAADPINNEAAREFARAQRAAVAASSRDAIERAKETFGATEAKCDICHKPLNVRNDGCASKAHAFS